jgi:hypothetical protein
MEFFANLIGGVQTGGQRKRCPKCKRGLVRSNACVSKVERHNQIMNSLPASQVQYKRASDALREKIDAVLYEVAQVHKDVGALSNKNIAPLKAKNSDASLRSDTLEQAKRNLKQVKTRLSRVKKANKKATQKLIEKQQDAVNEKLKKELRRARLERKLSIGI